LTCLELFGARIISREPDHQTTDVQTRIAIMNRVKALGTAEIEAIA
jgi:hypothetical protein